ncbi:hypothetical protein K474DRAFT_1658133 [Panus rudis PR-1116 ss-1]|nr:hypothetical protein K474DRAFT_1658133 [Panus rudis PR-1116 ss-1]
MLPSQSNLKDTDSRVNFLRELSMTKLTKTGWIIGPEEELVLWVPQEYHDSLIVQPGPGSICTHIIGYQGTVGVDMSHSAHGLNWTKCWHARAV